MGIFLFGLIGKERLATSLRVSNLNISSLKCLVSDMKLEHPVLRFKCDYTGEVDQSGKICGHGIITSKIMPCVKWEGTFFNG